ncbi:MAG: hypothetical protein NC350_00405 [Corallococcus sp.]|nr:hypothetical protein [Corallococcus sp.]
MLKTQLKFQKIMSYVLLILAALVFVYSLGLMTDLYDMLYNALRKIDDEYIERVSGAILYVEMQPYNKLLTSLSIVLIVIALSLFATNSHKRRLYHVGNYVATGLVATANIAMAIWGMIQTSIFRAMFLKIDFVALKEYNEKWGSYYTESTFWFDIGYVIYALLIAGALACVGNLIWKVILMKREKQLLAGNIIKEATEA